MAKLISNSLLALLFMCCSSCASAEKETNDQPRIKFDNSLKECVSVEAHKVEQNDNTSLLDIKYTTEKPIGYCGCKSALAQYSVSNSSKEISRGMIEFPQQNAQVNITLSNTPKLLNDKPLDIEITCAQPQ